MKADTDRLGGGPQYVLWWVRVWDKKVHLQSTPVEPRARTASTFSCCIFVSSRCSSLLLSLLQYGSCLLLISGFKIQSNVSFQTIPSVRPKSNYE
jgi:hypothetical protein